MDAFGVFQGREDARTFPVHPVDKHHLRSDYASAVPAIPAP
jgi:hypothetical protein